jgi:hypothetical protein
MSQVQAKLPTDNWVKATWDEYIKAIGDPAYEKARSGIAEKVMLDLT